MKSSSESDCRVVYSIDFESSPKVCQMHDIPHYRCIMNLVMSTLNYICAHPPSLFSPFFPRLINIEGNGRSNSSCITTQGRVSSMHLKHTHMFPSVIQWEKKRITQHCWSELLSLPRSALTRGPWQKQWCLRCREPWVCPSLINKNSRPSCPVAADRLVCVGIDTSSEQAYLYDKTEVDTHRGACKQKHTNTRTRRGVHA